MLSIYKSLNCLLPRLEHIGNVISDKEGRKTWFAARGAEVEKEMLAIIALEFEIF